MVVSQKLIARYAELKAEAPGCLLLMQVGTFMQVQGDDARAVASVTGLKLQMGGEVDSPVVLGGFPKSGLDAYVGKLVRTGTLVDSGAGRAPGMSIQALVPGHPGSGAGGPGGEAPRRARPIGPVPVFRGPSYGNTISSRGVSR